MCKVIVSLARYQVLAKVLAVMFVGHISVLTTLHLRYTRQNSVSSGIHTVKHAVIHHTARKQNKNIEEIISIEVLSRCIDWVFSHNGPGTIEISVRARVIYL